jgi:hypothetical protein
MLTQLTILIKTYAIIEILYTVHARGTQECAVKCRAAAVVLDTCIFQVKGR